MGNKTKETLYDISIENTTITLLPKNNLNKKIFLCINMAHRT